jgi:hypothetical protein
MDFYVKPIPDGRASQSSTQYNTRKHISLMKFMKNSGLENIILLLFGRFNPLFI